MRRATPDDSSCPIFQQLKNSRNLSIPAHRRGATARLPILLPPMQVWIDHLITLLALPQFGLSTVFIIAFVSATLLPVSYTHLTLPTSDLV